MSTIVDIRRLKVNQPGILSEVGQERAILGSRRVEGEICALL